MAITNPSIFRDEIADLLDTALGSGGSDIVQQVYNYEADDFDGQSPVIVVRSSGADPEIATAATRINNDVLIQVLIFALYSATGWTPKQCDDKIDEVYKGVIDTLFSNANVAREARTGVSLDGDTVDIPVREIQTDGRSTIVGANVGGENYKMGVVPIKIVARDN